MLLEWLKWTNKIILCSQTREILLEAIFGVCYSMTFSVCLVSVQNTDTILFTLSFEDTKPLSTRD